MVGPHAHKHTHTHTHAHDQSSADEPGVTIIFHGIFESRMAVALSTPLSMVSHVAEERMNLPWDQIRLVLNDQPLPYR